MAFCMCCEQDSLKEGNGNFEICPICNWEDDPVQNEDRYLWGGANFMCLALAQNIYQMMVSVTKSVKSII